MGVRAELKRTFCWAGSWRVPKFLLTWSELMLQESDFRSERCFGELTSPTFQTTVSSGI